MAHSIAPTLRLVLLILLTAGAPLAADDLPQPEELFRTLDANGDGVLSADEIGEPQRQAFERLLRVGDADNDGRLSREEYITGLEPDPPSGTNAAGRGPGRDGRPQRPDIGRLFELGDRDGDGRIALKDLPEPFRQRMQPLFERIGKDQLTREDFERLGGMPALERRRVRPQFGAGGFFDRLDKDHSRGVSREELPDLLRQRFEPIFERLDKQELSRSDFERVMRHLRSQAEVLEVERTDPDRRPEAGRAMIALGSLLDTDGDGQLTMTEIQRLNDTFTELDTDGDGRLSGAEMRAFAARLMSPGNRRPTARPDAENENSRSRRPDDSPGDSE